MLSLVCASRELDLSDNQLTCAIPESIGTLLKLRYVQARMHVFTRVHVSCQGVFATCVVTVISM